MKILVLGGNGFVGTNLIKKLIENNHKITVFDMNFPKRKLNSVEYLNGDFTNIQNYKHIFKDIDIVYHLISATVPNSKRENFEFDIQTNLISTIRLLNVCLDMNVKKVIFASSGGTVYGESSKINSEDDACNPIGAYGINKFAIERYFESFYKYYGLNYTILRIANPYGNNHHNKKQGLINVILDNIKNGKDIEIWGDGEVKRDYIHINDVCEAFVAALNYSGNKKIFNICSSNSISINELIDMVRKITNEDFNVNYTKCRNVDIQVNLLDNTLAKKELNWFPKISLEQGIKELWNNEKLN